MGRREHKHSKRAIYLYYSSYSFYPIGNQVHLRGIMTKTIQTRQVTRIVWQAYYIDELGNPTSDKVIEALNEADAKRKLKENKA